MYHRKMLALSEPLHEISNNVACATSKGSDQPAHMRLCCSLKYSMSVKLLTEQPLEFINLKGGCRDSSEFTHVKMPHFVNHMSRLKWLSRKVCESYTVLQHSHIIQNAYFLLSVLRADLPCHKILLWKLWHTGIDICDFTMGLPCYLTQNVK